MRDGEGLVAKTIIKLFRVFFLFCCFFIIFVSIFNKKHPDLFLKSLNTKDY